MRGYTQLTREQRYQIYALMKAEHNQVAIATILVVKMAVIRKTFTCVINAIIELLTPFKEWVYTLTADNGREFLGHVEIAKELAADFYFAHPFSS
ncbi:hypothetical protein MNBD_GAMMA12-1447 [hydrothermal vent metagenome]|uniref:Integrase catalytic domain-containing protein n=1 Tax=hydrothermal vent metagenome TaxID=652676 RepID=A0A3B0YSW7_9ZZZZ